MERIIWQCWAKTFRWKRKWCLFSDNKKIGALRFFNLFHLDVKRIHHHFVAAQEPLVVKPEKWKLLLKILWKKIMLSSPSHCHGILIAVKPVSALVKPWNCKPWASLSFHLWWDFDIFCLDTFNYFWQSHISLISISLTVMDVLSSVTVLGLFSCTQHCEAFWKKCVLTLEVYSHIGRSVFLPCWQKSALESIFCKAH